jgi:hypothetical protein
MAPNIFKHAPKELSQDAFICWLLEWADQENATADDTLHRIGVAFLNTLLSLHNQPNVEDVGIKIHRQLKHTDIVAEVGRDLVLLIEDKVRAGTTYEILKRYKESIEKVYPDRKVLAVFFKTRDQSNYAEVERADYRLFLREQLLDTLSPWRSRTGNAIYSDFLAHHELYHALVESYAVKPLAEWTQQGVPWMGLYKRLQRELPDLDWGWVNNTGGGFWGAWWHSKPWTDPEAGSTHSVYLQLEQGQLAFKIEVSEGDRAGLRNRWHTRLMAAARDLQLPVLRPVMRPGTWMTVGRIQEEYWLAKGPDGLLDLPTTLSNLRRAAHVLDHALATRLNDAA